MSYALPIAKAVLIDADKELSIVNCRPFYSTPADCFGT